jgi:hypothetical protein
MRFGDYCHPRDERLTEGMSNRESGLLCQTLARILQSLVRITQKKEIKELSRPGAVRVRCSDKPSFPISFLKCETRAISKAKAMILRRKDDISAAVSKDVVQSFESESRRVIAMIQVAEYTGHEFKKLEKLYKNRHTDWMNNKPSGPRSSDDNTF